MNLKNQLSRCGQDQREDSGLPEEHRYEIKTEELIIRAGEKEIYGRIAYPVTDGKCPRSFAVMAITARMNGITRNATHSHGMVSWHTASTFAAAAPAPEAPANQQI